MESSLKLEICLAASADIQPMPRSNDIVKILFFMMSEFDGDLAALAASAAPWGYLFVEGLMLVSIRAGMDEAA